MKYIGFARAIDYGGLLLAAYAGAAILAHTVNTPIQTIIHHVNFLLLSH